jgi:hypothetical protein
LANYKTTEQFFEEKLEEFWKDDGGKLSESPCQNEAMSAAKSKQKGPDDDTR